MSNPLSPDDLRAIRAVVDAAGALPIDTFYASPELAAAIEALYARFEDQIEDLDRLDATSEKS